MPASWTLVEWTKWFPRILSKARDHRPKNASLVTRIKLFLQSMSNAAQDERLEEKASGGRRLTRPLRKISEKHDANERECNIKTAMQLSGPLLMIVLYLKRNRSLRLCGL
jgi:hypothetical protein